MMNRNNSSHQMNKMYGINAEQIIGRFKACDGQRQYSITTASVGAVNSVGLDFINRQGY